MIRLLIVDDEALIRDGLRAIVDSEPDIEVAGEAGDGDEAVAQVRQLKPDVVLMDIRMPGVDGIEATRRILATPTSPKIILLTTFDRNEYVYEALTAGATGFLLKDVRRRQLVEAVRAAVTGDTLISPSITRRLVEQFCRTPEPTADHLTALSELTPRETEVLTLVGRGLSNAEIAERLFVAETTVKTHLARILTKTSTRDRTQAVILAYEAGLITPGHPPNQ